MKGGGQHDSVMTELKEWFLFSWKSCRSGVVQVLSKRVEMLSSAMDAYLAKLSPRSQVP